MGIKGLIWFAVGLVALFALGGSYRAALMTSFILAIIALSFVVVTGYVGQISFVQYTLVGASALLLSRDDHRVEASRSRSRRSSPPSPSGSSACSSGCPRCGSAA